MGVYLRLHSLTRLGDPPSTSDGGVGVPTEPEGHPAQDVPEERNAQHASLQDGKVQMTPDRVEILDQVADVGGSGECAPGD